MRITVDELDVFKLSGPTHLVESGVTWSHPNSLRAAMACLVQAVYAMDKDRSLAKMGLPTLAPDWYVPFRYKLVKTMEDREETTDKENSTIVGAVFKWSRRLMPIRVASAPKVVVALRGTIPSVKSDLSADLDLILLQLHTVPRFKLALKEVEQAIARFGHGKVVITGHSLGAAICLLIGRTLAEKNCFIQAHLFNPPFPSLHHFLSLRSLASALVASFLISEGVQFAEMGLDHQKEGKQDVESQQARAGDRLKQWLPHLYINTHDPVCADYVGFLEHIENILQEQISGGASKGSSSQSSGAVNNGLRSLVQSWFGRETKPFHLIPSAYLHVMASTASSQGFMKSHGMKQWWAKEQEPSITTRLAGFALSPPA